ncbi:2-oxo acid dehydrogenase subunit E2 [Enterobacteriaceae endosymbiont of Donacia dentata]|uniref:2-oxo acid dehydrogenase subunit E2 n=1 Tax=Enterobacteriaceae endosymbiont of Donacia dentata TaxID=2675777 RepID=UPI0014490205|nr:2-oxo acid dehydrogenase subunit E2 [Enterobacteriaceae endosymbiont of Donacia dentata]QJC32475.1 pyruvate dehydrogenase [Enterobacteriaceae endosymbiont of Donacia dentata]
MNIKIIFPDTGIEEMKITDILVKEGEKITKEQSIIMVESDKTSMEIPSNHSGIVKKILVSVGEKICKGNIILEILNEQQEKDDFINKKKLQEDKILFTALRIPNIGMQVMKVIKILVKKNDLIIENQSLLMIQNKKNIFEIASLYSGIIKKININIHDIIKSNDIFMYINYLKKDNKNLDIKTFIKNNNFIKNNINSIFDKKLYIHTSPIVRKIARKLKINLNNIKASGLKNRITKEDILKYIENKNKDKDIMNNISNNSLINYKIFGAYEKINLNNIQKISGKNLTNNWKNIPHVTQHIEADITELEKFRIKKNIEFLKNKNNIKLTLLSFIIKTCACALKKYPNFNSSLSDNNEILILKKYFNIGIAINTNKGLFVPVIFDVLNKNINKISEIILNLADKAKNYKLNPNDVKGGCFTISNLGQFKGNFFTPIINAPEVAILGISQAETKPIWDISSQQFLPKLILPLSLSYDHRVINGVEGINFLNYICSLLSDIRNILI